MKKYYYLTEEELLILLTDSIRLKALETGGVDNWSWYGDSINDFINSWVEENFLDSKYYWEIEDIAKSELKNYSSFCVKE